MGECRGEECKVREWQGGGKPRPYISGEHTLPFAAVHHADLWGVREVDRHDTPGQVTLGDGKYAWLAAHNLSNTQWKVLNPQAPYYLFSPQESSYFTEYNSGWSIADIFRPNGDPAPGVVTCHDQFAISWTKNEACAKIESFLSTGTEEEARQIFRLVWRRTLAQPVIAVRKCTQCARSDVLFFNSLYNTKRGGTFDLLDFARGHKSRQVSHLSPDLLRSAGRSHSHRQP